jgi:hypothetical protein
MTKQMDWVISHPRDPDQSFLHVVWTGALRGLAWISGVLGAGVGVLLGAGSWLLHHTWIFGAAVLAALGVLSKHFNGSFLNHFLTNWFLWPMLGALTVLRLGAGALGLRGLASWFGAANTFVFNVGSLGVAVLTGLQGEGESSVGGVLIAMVSDYFLILKPLAAGTKVAELYGVASAKFASLSGFGDRIAGTVAQWSKVGILGRNGLVAWVGKANDFVMLRPSIVLRGLQISAKTSAGRVADIVSWIWRPQSAVVEGADHARALVAVVERNIAGAKEIVDRLAPGLETGEKLLHGWSAGAHLTYLGTTGHVQTVQPPRNLRPSELLRLHLSSGTQPIG